MKDLDPFILSSLLSKYTLGKLSQEEERLLEDWLELKSENRKLFESYLDEQRLHADLRFMASVNMQDDWREVLNKINTKNKTDSLTRYWKYVAVAVLILLVTSTFLFHYKNDDLGIVADESGRKSN